MVYEDLILKDWERIATDWYERLVEVLNEIVAAGISKLSQLEIDVDKDWGTHVIKNLGAPVAAGDVYSKGHVIDLADIPTITYAKLSIADSLLVSDIKSTEFDVANKLVKLDASGYLKLSQIYPNVPGLDASGKLVLTQIGTKVADLATLWTKATKITYGDLDVADDLLTSDIKSTEFNVANKLLKLDASALVPLAQIPTPLTGKSADMVDGCDAGLSDNDVCKLPVATEGKILKRGAVAWEAGDPPVCFMDFWSDPQEEVSITSTAGDKTLPNVVVAGLPSGITLIRVICMLKMRALENTHTTIINKLNGNQYVQVQKSGGSYTNAILLVDDLWTIGAATREGGDLVMGAIDVKTTVDANATYNFKIASAQADQNELHLNDLQTGIRIYFR